MCEFASFVVLRESARVLWKPGIDSHSEILKQFNLDDNKYERWFDKNVCFVEIVPSYDRKDPIKYWDFHFDYPDREKPDWWTSEHENNCWSALRERLKAEKKEYCVVNEYGDNYWYVEGKLTRIKYFGSKTTIVFNKGKCKWENEKPKAKTSTRKKTVKKVTRKVTKAKKAIKKRKS